ncbi:hypothetical protein HCH_03569 [Hahella chejuensis KCTC 2396]|uniref:Uncharacterized protein n=1 Tax=Hahella chejuensis (strain KCTC 2396) TaxID=349521 RepID=Q2SGB4_HAHCH|nr:hypothetical protein HCH_03569 [Hahella chejuensis KCTC 2396]
MNKMHPFNQLLSFATSQRTPRQGDIQRDGLGFGVVHDFTAGLWHGFFVFVFAAIERQCEGNEFFGQFQGGQGLFYFVAAIVFFLVVPLSQFGSQYANIFPNGVFSFYFIFDIH